MRLYRRFFKRAYERGYVNGWDAAVGPAFKEGWEQAKETYSRELEGQKDGLKGQVETWRTAWYRDTEKWQEEVARLKEELEEKDGALRGAREYMSQWPSAEKYIAEIDAALSPHQRRNRERG